MGLNGPFGYVVSFKKWYHVGEEEAPHLTMAESSWMTRGAGLLHDHWMGQWASAMTTRQISAVPRSRLSFA